jgi:hypothetical protein
MGNVIAEARAQERFERVVSFDSHHEAVPAKMNFNNSAFVG